MAFYMERDPEQPRNPRKALLLALLLGPIGMFYATVTWASIMLLLNLILGVITYGVAILILWPIGANIASNAVCRRNQRLLGERNNSDQRVVPISESEPLKVIGQHLKTCIPFDSAQNSVAQLNKGDKGRATGLISPLALRIYGIIRSGGGSLVSGRDQRKRRSNALITGKMPVEGPDANDQTGQMVESRLSRLKALRERDLIDESEFREKKKAILDEL